MLIVLCNSGVCVDLALDGVFTDGALHIACDGYILQALDPRKENRDNRK